MHRKLRIISVATFAVASGFLMSGCRQQGPTTTRFIICSSHGTTTTIPSSTSKCPQGMRYDGITLRDSPH